MSKPTWEVRDLAEMPPTVRQGARMQALCGLVAGQALFEPVPDGRSLKGMASRWATTAINVGVRIHTRQDPKANGVWVWLRDQTPASPGSDSAQDDYRGEGQP